MNETNIGFIGAGNMARSIIGGLVAQGYSGARLFASDPHDANLTALVRDYAITPCEDNTAVAAHADVVLLAVKPQIMAAVCRDLVGKLKPGTLVVSIAAGITCGSLANWLGHQTPLVRCMPNTPALVQEGASALFANALVTEEQKVLADAILAAVGIVEWVAEETLLDAVTAVSGSGPAYFFLVLEAMIRSGEAQGLSRGTARALAVQTALGAAKLAAASDLDIADLRRQVTSPGGTTEQAIQSLEEDNLAGIFSKAMQRCADRARELAQQLGE